MLSSFNKTTFLQVINCPLKRKSNHIKPQCLSDSLFSSPHDDIISLASQAQLIAQAPTVDKFSNEYEEDPYFWIIKWYEK